MTGSLSPQVNFGGDRVKVGSIANLPSCRVMSSTERDEMLTVSEKERYRVRRSVSTTNHSSMG